MKYVQQHVNTLPAHTVHSVCCDVFLSVLPSSISIRQAEHQCLTSASISHHLSLSHTHYSAVKHACKEPWVFWCGLKFYEERRLFTASYLLKARLHGLRQTANLQGEKCRMSVHIRALILLYEDGMLKKSSYAE